MDAKPRILVVDGDEAIRENFNQVLSQSGYLVDTAADGLVALNRLASTTYDLAFVDLRMSGMNGEEVARTIHNAQPGVQVVILSGVGTDPIVREASAIGVCADKPIEPDGLRRLAEVAMSRKQLHLPPPDPTPPIVRTFFSAEERTPSVFDLIRGAVLGMLYLVFMPFIAIAMVLWMAGARLIYGAGAK